MLPEFIIAEFYQDYEPDSEELEFLYKYHWKFCGLHWIYMRSPELSLVLLRLSVSINQYYAVEMLQEAINLLAHNNNAGLKISENGTTTPETLKALDALMSMGVEEEEFIRYVNVD